MSGHTKPSFNHWLFALFFIALAAVWLLYANMGTGSPASDNLGPHPDRILKVRDFDPDQFVRTLSVLDVNSITRTGAVKGAVIPHDLTAGQMIADLFVNLQNQNPKTIILLGPNHLEQGGHQILTGTGVWQTEFGQIQPDLDLIKLLVTAGFAALNNPVISQDQSLTSVIPYISYFLPRSRVVPLLISSFMSRSDIGRISEFLAGNIGADTVVVAAVDFSHYLPKAQAAEKDRKTLEIIKEKDYDRLLKLGSDYTDGPASLAILLMTMDFLGINRMEVAGHNNSDDFFRQKSHSTTSYYYLIFPK